MNIPNPFRAWKAAVIAGLGLLLLADAALAVYLWKAHSEGPLVMRQQRDRLSTQAKLLQADVARGEAIRASLPQVGKDCDAFYQDQFLPAATGYSSIVSDL